ncbi:MAG: hypothetical protein GW760_02605 [Legionella sp.]|nr:hypothetical protein [Legionella sp.]
MPRRIAVLTSYMHQRGGDIVSAMSFIKSVLATDPAAQFEWVVKRDISSFNRDLEAFKATELGAFSNQVYLTCIDSSDYQNFDVRPFGVFNKLTEQQLKPDELTRLSDTNWGVQPRWLGWQDIHQKIETKQTADRLRACDMIAMVANPHRMVKADHQFLHNQFKKPIKLIPEYDLYHTNCQTWGYRNAEVIQTGLNGAGVYIDETITARNGLDDSAPEDAAFITYLMADDVEQYRQNNRLYYGYFFDNEQLSPANFTVKTAFYLSNSIMLAIDSGEKYNIDIVIPGFKCDQALQDIFKQVLSALPKQYKDALSSIYYDTKQQDGTFNRVQMPTDQNDGLYQLRLINPRRLERKTVQSLLNDSEPWVGLTGDASWIEGLMKGKIVCYQVVVWKQSFFNAFIQYLTKKMPHDSYLLKFYLLQKCDRINSERNFEQMRLLYRNHLPEMRADARKLAEFIIQEKNLSITMSKALVESIKVRNQSAPGQQTNIDIESIGRDSGEADDSAYHWYFEMLNSPAFKEGGAALIAAGLIAIALSTCVPGVLGAVLLAGGVCGVGLGATGLGASLLYGFFKPVEPIHLEQNAPNMNLFC